MLAENPVLEEHKHREIVEKKAQIWIKKARENVLMDMGM